MRRRLFTLFACLSLLLGLVASILWVRSALIGGEFEHTSLDPTQHHATLMGVQWVQGHLCIFRQQEDVTGRHPMLSGPVGWHYWREGMFVRYPAFQWWSAGYYHNQHPLSFGVTPGGTVQASVIGEVRLLYVPFWEMVMLMAVLPGLWLFGTRRRRRKMWALSRRCPHCGYDLRATPEPNGPLLAAARSAGRQRQRRQARVRRNRCGAGHSTSSRAFRWPPFSPRSFCGPGAIGEPTFLCGVRVQRQGASLAPGSFRSAPPPVTAPFPRRSSRTRRHLSKACTITATAGQRGLMSGVGRPVPFIRDLAGSSCGIGPCPQPPA